MQNKLYFPSLDGLRFFAFFLVFLHHALQNTTSQNPIINYLLIILQKNGWVGVDLFFVLSGFLITILLLEERKQFSNFSLRNFWIRRALRIWPLYFLALILGFILIPLILNQFREIRLINELKNQVIYYILFLGNWATVAFGYSNFKYISHLWTISVEEQFYIFWPLLLLQINNFKKAAIACLSIFLMAILIRFYLISIGIQHPGIYTNTFARFDTLIAGSFLALLYFYKPNVTKFLQKFCNLKIQIITLLLFAIFLYKFYFFNPYFIRNGLFGYSVITIFFVYFTLSALKQKSHFSSFLKFKPFVSLGKISYGLYVWHILAIDIIYVFLGNLFPNFSKPFFGFILTLILGFISYNLFEKYFLTLKQRFTKIISRPI